MAFRLFVDDVTGITFQYDLQQIYSDGGYHCSISNIRVPHRQLLAEASKTIIADCLQEVVLAPIHSFNRIMNI